MAEQYDNTNRGALFINNRRTTDKHPNMTGSINVDGREYWISGWTKFKSSSGEKFLSLSVTPKEQQTQRGEPTGSAVDGMDRMPGDGDVPF